MTSLLYVGDPDRALVWRRIAAERWPDLDFRVHPDVGDPGEVDYLVTWLVSPELLTGLTNLRAVFSLGAGLDHLDLSSFPGGLPVVRMVEPGLTETMVGYVTMAVLALHRDLFAYGADQRHQTWQPRPVRAALTRRVGVMGLGVLGQAVLEALAPFGFPLAGYSRTLKTLPGVRCCVGEAALDGFLAGCDILVCLLPLTPGTRGILDAARLRCLPTGASLVNVGRGGHVVEADLLRALDEGHLAHAVLDVFAEEPPPADHPFWHHPQIAMTPHIAAATRPETAAPTVIEAIYGHMAGRPLSGALDRARGY